MAGVFSGLQAIRAKNLSYGVISHNLQYQFFLCSLFWVLVPLVPQNASQKTKPKLRFQ